MVAQVKSGKRQAKPVERGFNGARSAAFQAWKAFKKRGTYIYSQINSTDQYEVFTAGVQACQESFPQCWSLNGTPIIYAPTPEKLEQERLKNKAKADRAVKNQEEKVKGIRRSIAAELEQERREDEEELAEQRAEVLREWAELEQKKAELEQKEAELDQKKAELDQKKAELDQKSDAPTDAIALEEELRHQQETNQRQLEQAELEAAAPERDSEARAEHRVIELARIAEEKEAVVAPLMQENQELLSAIALKDEQLAAQAKREEELTHEIETMKQAQEPPENATAQSKAFEVATNELYQAKQLIKKVETVATQFGEILKDFGLPGWNNQGYRASTGMTYRGLAALQGFILDIKTEQIDIQGGFW